VGHAERLKRGKLIDRPSDGSTPDVKHAIQVYQQASDVSSTYSHAE